MKDPDCYVVDTVFVVAKIEDCNKEKIEDYKDICNGVFYNAVLNKIYYGNGSENTFENKIIYGASYENPINGMYSFFPCHKASYAAYPRLQIDSALHKEISLKLSSGGKYIIEDDKNAVIDFWGKLRQYTLDMGYLVGVKADLPLILTPEQIPEYIKNLK